jgi:tRNA(Arg) A34 adenosine deaminase TadA
MVKPVPDKILRSAIRNAQRSSFKYRLGAVVFQNNKIISTGFNKGKSHPITKEYKEFGSIHAEIDAMLQTTNTNGNNLLVVRILSCNTLAISKPCEMCQQIIRKNGIRTVYYIDENQKIKHTSL